MLQSGSSHPNEQRGEEGNRMGSNCKMATENVTVQKVKKKRSRKKEKTLFQCLLFLHAPFFLLS